MRRASRRVAAVLLALLALVLTPVVASAHAILESTTPDQGSQVASAPTSVTLDFSESVGINSRSIQVYDPGGKRVDDGSTRHPGGHDDQVSVGFENPLRDKQSYTVVWHVVSSDSHPIAGSFAFGVGVPAPAVAAPDVSGDPTVRDLHAVARGVGFLSLLLLVGGTTFLLVCWREGIGSRGLRRMLVGSWIGLGVSTAALFLLQGPYGSGLGIGDILSKDLIDTTLATRYGKLQLVRLLLLGLVIPLAHQLAVDLRKREKPSFVDLVGVGVVAFLTFSLGGHPSVGIQVPVAVTLDSLHIAAASVWLGGLVVLVGWVLRRPAGELVEVLPRWSLLAQGAVGVLVATGAYASWRQIGTLHAYTGTTYGKLLLVKTGIVVVMLAVAWWSHQRVVSLVGHPVGVPLPGLHPRVVAHAAVDLEAAPAPAAPDAGSLRRAVAVEAVLGIVVVALTAVLVNTRPAREAYAPRFDKSLVATGLAGDSIAVTVDVTTTKAGPETIHVYTFTKEGKQLAFAQVTGTLVKRGSDVQVRAPFQNTGLGHATAEAVPVVQSGVWDLTVQIRVDEVHAYAAETSYTVR